MTDIVAIRAVRERLNTAIEFSSVFGVLPSGTTEEQRDALHKNYGSLAKLVHPDKATFDDHDEATEAFQKLSELWSKAEAAIKAGQYNTPIAAIAARSVTTVIKSRTAVYRLEGTPFREGDFSLLYKAKIVGLDEEVLVKISADPTLNGYLEAEANFLVKFSPLSVRKDPKLASVAYTVPTLLDTFHVMNAGKRYRVNVTNYQEMISVADILKSYPTGLPGIDAGWIARRVIAQTLVGPMAGYVNTAIVPEHILLDPVTRNPVHIGWTHAQPRSDSTRVTSVLDRYRSYYPPEVFAKEHFGHRGDVYMAAQVVLQLFGGASRMPPKLQAVLSKAIAVHPSQRLDGKTFLEQFTDVVRSTWGRQYRPLELK